MKRFTSKEVGKYYDSTIPFYWLYHLNSNGVHFGFSDSSTHGVREAILNTNKFLAEKVKVKSGEHILDAGCGIGGSSIWLAKHFKNVRITGISVSENQIKKAKVLARKEDMYTHTRFLVMDYTKTTFKKNSFDVVWAIESVCYALRKIDFLKEAYRILKPGGRLIVSDGFLNREPVSEKEKKVLQTFYTGYHLNSIPTFKQFRQDMKAVGFHNITLTNMNHAIRPSLDRAYHLGKIGYPFALLGNKLGLLPDVIVDNALTAIAQKEGFDLGIGGYGVFYAEKS